MGSVLPEPTPSWVGELGYWVVPSAPGRSAAPRAVEAVSGWAFKVLGRHRLELLYSVHNLASRRVAEGRLRH
jgi:[ribosomal protein S5]-alanine N-acetyltransferase